jgi:hypothetical protein
MLEEDILEPSPLIEGDTMEQRRVSLGVRDDDIGRRQDNFPEAPDAGSGRARLPASPFGKTLAQISRHQIWLSVADFEQTAANDAAWVRIRLNNLVPAREADLPAQWTLGVEPHR